MEKFRLAGLGLLAIVLIFAGSLLIVGGLTYLCSLAVHFEFSWMLVLGIWSLAVLLKFLFK